MLLSGLYNRPMPLPLSNKPPTPASPVRAVYCTGTVRNGSRKGEQCTKLAVLGHNRCMSHGAQLPSVRKFAAEYVEEKRMQMVELSDLAIETLEDVMRPGVSDAVRLKAATEVLDRIGIRGGIEMNVSVNDGQDPAQLLRDRLNRLKDSVNPVIDGEAVSPVYDHAQAELEESRNAEDRPDDTVIS